jgi:hypothetical protein
MVNFLYNKGLCFHRLPFDIIEKPSDRNHPLWDELMSRCSDPGALQAFIGSLFIPQSDRQQYLWLYGQGLNGKSTIIKFLDRCFGPAAFSTETPTKEDKFWTYRLLGKRLVTFGDCADHEFPSSQKFKMLTGGDKIPIEPKGRQAFNAELMCKFVFGSNEKLYISGQKADVRRAIFCKIDPIKGDIDPDYLNRLWSEAPSILGECLMKYDHLCTTDHNPIPTDSQEIECLIEQNETDLNYLFERYFETDNRTDVSENERYRFSRTEFAKFCRFEKLTKEQVNDFIKFLEYRYKVSFKIIKTSNGPRRAYVGAWARNTDIQEHSSNGGAYRPMITR